jgi:hypothetical protein
MRVRSCALNETLSLLPDLHDGLLAMDLEHLSCALLSILQREVDDPGVLRQLHVVQNHQRTLHRTHSRVVWSGGNKRSSGASA